MYANQTKAENIYKIWMEDYSGPPSKSLSQYLSICNQIASQSPENAELMGNIYKQAVQMEFDFWDDCYKIE